MDYFDGDSKCLQCGEIHTCPDCETIWSDNDHGEICPKCGWDPGFDSPKANTLLNHDAIMEIVKGRAS